MDDEVVAETAREIGCEGTGAGAGTGTEAEEDVNGVEAGLLPLPLPLLLAAATTTRLVLEVTDGGDVIKEVGGVCPA